MRNPALNLAVMYGVTDIPDWCFVESGMTYDPTKPGTAENIAQLLSHSPTTLADKVPPGPLCHCVTVSVCVCWGEGGSGGVGGGP